MTRANDIASLVDSNGDIVAGALDNVPPSNDASALTTGTLDMARVANGSVTNAHFAAGAADLSHDTTPELGGALDAQTNNITNVGNLGIGGTPSSELHLSSAAPIITSTASNGSSGLRINVTGQSGGQILRVQGDNTTHFQVNQDGEGIFEDTLNVNGHIYGNNGNAKLQLGFDRIYTNSGMSLTTSAQNTYVNSSNLLDTGSYIIRVHVTGGGWYSEVWSGIMSWYAGTTNSNDADDIYMTGMGHAASARNIYARVKRYGGNNNNHSLQIWTNSASSGSTVHIDAKRLY